MNWKDNVVSEQVVGSGVALSSAVKEVFEGQRSGNTYMCLVYYVLFQWLREALEHSSKDILETVQALIFNQP